MICPFILMHFETSFHKKVFPLQDLAHSIIYIHLTTLFLSKSPLITMSLSSFWTLIILIVAILLLNYTTFSNSYPLTRIKLSSLNLDTPTIHLLEKSFNFSWSFIIFPLRIFFSLLNLPCIIFSNIMLKRMGKSTARLFIMQSILNQTCLDKNFNPFNNLMTTLIIITLMITLII